MGKWSGKYDNDDLVGCGCGLLILGTIILIGLGTFIGVVAAVTYTVKTVWNM